jgi:hypothetical protein
MPADISKPVIQEGYRKDNRIHIGEAEMHCRAGEVAQLL